jgi:hypothetical protein
MNANQLTVEQAQRQIEELQKHIEYLKSTPETYEERVKQLLQQSGLDLQVYGWDIKIVADKNSNFDGHVMLPLPNANNEWSTAAFQYAIDLCTKLQGNDKVSSVYHELGNTFRVGQNFFGNYRHALAIRLCLTWEIH